MCILISSFHTYKYVCCMNDVVQMYEVELHTTQELYVNIGKMGNRLAITEREIGYVCFQSIWVPMGSLLCFDCQYFTDSLKEIWYQVYATVII